LECQTVMKTKGTLNKMPVVLMYRSKGHNDRTDWWLYIGAAMYTLDVLAKVCVCVSC
jgi:hypothetical protein